MDFRRPLVMVSRFWRIPVILAIGALAVYQFKTGAWTDSWTSVGAGVFLCLGLALNLVALILNNGFMPVRMKTIPEITRLVTRRSTAEPAHGFWAIGSVLPNAI